MIAPAQPPLFRPAARQALLVNRRWPAEEESRRSDYLVSNIESMLTMEAALQRGRLNLVEEITFDLHASRCSEALRASELAAALYSIALGVYLDDPTPGDHFWSKLNAQLPADSSEKFRYIARNVVYALQFIDAQSYTTGSPIHYSPLRKAFRDAQNVRTEVSKVLTDFASWAQPSTLTLLFFLTHGSPGSIDVFPYCVLYQLLNRIPGRKVAILTACYSGSFVDFVKRQPSAGDIAVIAFTTPGQTGTNWNEEKMIEKLTERIRLEIPLIEWDSEISAVGGVVQASYLHVPFNVVL